MKNRRTKKQITAILEAAPTHSYRELIEKFGGAYRHLAKMLSRHHVKIGKPESSQPVLPGNRKPVLIEIRDTVRFKQRSLHILAALIETTNDRHAEIARKFFVSREYVGQIAAIAMHLGLLEAKKFRNPSLRRPSSQPTHTQ